MPTLEDAKETPRLRSQTRIFAIASALAVAALLIPATASAYSHLKCCTAKATSISDETLSATINPGGAPTTYHFDYGPDNTYGTSTTETDIGSGANDVPASVSIGGLTGGNTYHYRLVITTSGSPTQDFDRTFVAGAPSVALGTASAGSSTATLRGKVNPGGQATTYHFEYGTTQAYGTRTDEDTAGSGTADVQVEEHLTGLTPKTTYCYRLVAHNGSGTVNTDIPGFPFCTAGFGTVTPFTVSVTKAGTGGGSVSSSPAGINCPRTCSAQFDTGQSVTLTPHPASGSTFAGWSGACSGTGTCKVDGLVSSNVKVTATFKPKVAAPDTRITKHPGKTVTTNKSTAKVTFKFAATGTATRFQCKLDKAAFATCTSPKSYKVKPGKHTFQVRAVGPGGTDATPASFSFKLVKTQ